MRDPAAALVEERTGLDLAALGLPLVRARLREQRAELGLADPAAHARRLAGDAAALERLVELLVVHETWFFRYPASFRLLGERARAWRRRRPARPVRVLSLACSTGEEGWSIAIALREAGLAPPDFEVEALDVSPAAIARAKAGCYGGRALRDLAPERLARWFEPDGSRWRVGPALRTARVRFAVANLHRLVLAAPPGAYDAVFCRNVLIYLQPAARARLLARVHAALAGHGLLFVGHAEVEPARAAAFGGAPEPETFALERRPGPPAPAADPAPAPAAAPVGGPRPPGAPAEPRTAHPPPAAGPHPPEPPRRAGWAPDPDAEDPVAGALRRANAGDLAGALARLEHARATCPPSPALFCALAAVLGASGRDAEVEGALTRALYLDPDHYEALVHLALVVEARGDLAHGRRLRARAARARAQRAAGAGEPHG